MIDFNKIIKIKTNDMRPSKGKILISEPLLSDNYFKRSVVLLAEHNEEGSFGIILNKPIDNKFNEIVPDFPEFSGSLFLGGPVSNSSLFFIHTLGDKIDNSQKIMDGLYWGGDIESVRELMMLKQIDHNQIRFCVGYSGWGSNQLEDELKRNSWLVAGLPVETLMNKSPDDLWEFALQKLDREYSYWSNFPTDPGMN
ncbi:MAG: YqgE/AlgH family protein [Bacteroidales bacterium]|nr:YqgE/AlgH family protein [Bacteroidales bacterium]